MKRPKLRKASKRMTCAKKYRIRKNVAAHNKKMRKLSKTNGGKSFKRKDPGVPASAPFKEAVLREAELQKEKYIEEKKLKKQQSHKLVNQNPLLELQKDAINRQKLFTEKTTTTIVTSASSFDINSESSRKTFYREFQKVVEIADVLIEVLDARDPLGCRCLEMEKSLISSGKKIVLLLNKIDLVPKENVEEWLKYLRNEFPTVAFKANTQTQTFHSRQKIPIAIITKDILSNSSQCVGADSLMKLLSNYCRNLNIQTSITVGVIGFPNVGKSSVINSLKRAKACRVGSVPGVTKTMQEVSLNNHINILDCPGIVIDSSSSTSAMVLRNCVKVSSLDDPVTPVEAILNRCKKDQIMLRYKVGNYSDAGAFLEMLARKRGMLKKGGEPKVHASAKCILNDWNSGKITYYTRPPVKKEENNSSESRIVEKMSQEFDWDCLEEDNLNALQAVKGCPTHSSVLLFESTGPSKMTVGDIDVESGGEDKSIVSMKEDGSCPVNMELGNITIDIKEKTKKKIFNNSPEKTIDSLKVLTDGSNIQANKNIKQLIKLNKKKKKRADKLSDKLGDSLLSAMDFTAETSEDYDFNVDFHI